MYCPCWIYENYSRVMTWMLWGESCVMIYHIYMLWFKEWFVHILIVEGSFTDSGPACLSAARILYQGHREQVQTLAFYRSSSDVSYSVCPLSSDFLGALAVLLPFDPFLGAAAVLRVCQGARLPLGRERWACQAARCWAEEHDGKTAALEWAADSATSRDAWLIWQQGGCFTVL